MQAGKKDMPDYCEVELTWLEEENGFPGRWYVMAFKEQLIPISIMRIKECLMAKSRVHSACRVMVKDSTYICTLSAEFLLPIDQEKYNEKFFLRDDRGIKVLAQGYVRYRLRRSDNIHSQFLSIGRSDRENLNLHRGKVLWLTGLSGSGKTTLANALEVRLHAMSYRTYILDGDHLRQGLNGDLGFTEADRVENIRRVIEVAKLMLDAGLVVIAAFISPFRKERFMARQMIGEEDFFEIYLNTSLETCEKRDVKGLYKKARQGDLPNMSGIGSLYEEPTQPDLVVCGEKEENLASAVNTILAQLKFC